MFDRFPASRLVRYLVSRSIRSLICLVAFVSISADATPLQITKVGDSVIDPEALHFTNGSWGLCVNGQTFQQDAVTTFKNHQYAIYYDAVGRVCVARRASKANEWKILRFADYEFKGNDSHNVAVIGICPRDGTIHLSFDHHGHPLHYRVSRAGVALQPENFPWTTNLFGPITSELEPGRKLTRVTYPRFVRTPEGGLQFACRIGGSGDGEKCLADYDFRKGEWKDFGACFGSKGNYLGQTSRNPYLNGYNYDRKGWLHATWCWRESGDPVTNHDLAYAWSKDGGETWLNNAGQRIGRRGERIITIESPGLHIAEIGMKRGLGNAMTQAVDSRNRVHFVTFHLPDDRPQLPDWNATRQQVCYFHYWRDDKGKWQRNQMKFIGSRPQLWFDEKDNAYIVFVGDRFNPSPNLSVAMASAKSGWTDWSVIHSEAGPFSGQPQIDRYSKPGILSIYIQETATTARPAASPLRVMNFTATP